MQLFAPGAEWFRVGSIKSIMSSHTPDLAKQPPRSPRVRLGGYVQLPRMLDKCRAELGGKNGEYHYNCPLDQEFLSFAGIDAEALKQQVATGAGDGEILGWITANAKSKPNSVEIEAWSAQQERRAPNNPEGREYFNAEHLRVAPQRTDFVTWFDYLDIDDHASYGGKV